MCSYVCAVALLSMCAFVCVVAVICPFAICGLFAVDRDLLLKLLDMCEGLAFGIGHDSLVLLELLLLVCLGAPLEGGQLAYETLIV